MANVYTKADLEQEQLQEAQKDEKKVPEKSSLQQVMDYERNLYRSMTDPLRILAQSAGINLGKPASEEWKKENEVISNIAHMAMPGIGAGATSGIMATRFALPILKKMMGKLPQATKIAPKMTKGPAKPNKGWKARSFEEITGGAKPQNLRREPYFRK